MKPGQAQLMSIIGQQMPILAATMQLRPGVTCSETTFEQMKKSMSFAPRPAMSRAFCAASTARSSICSSEMTWREWMPVRGQIHASPVSRNWDISSLVTCLAGSALPVPMIFISGKSWG